MSVTEGKVGRHADHWAGWLRRTFVAAVAGLFVLGMASQVSFAADEEVWNGPTQPAKAPKGVKLAVVVCGFALGGCMGPGKSIEEAGKKLGWEVALFDGKADPKAQATAILAALATHPTALVTVAINFQTMQLPMHEAKKANVPVVSVGESGDSPDPPLQLKPGELGPEFGVNWDDHGMGVMMGKWIAKEMGGKANLVIYQDREFEGVVLSTQGVADGCEGCKVDWQQFTASQIGSGLGQQVVGYLRSHPDVNFVYGSYDPAAFDMVTAIRRAGMGDKVKVAADIALPENQNLIRKGDIQVASAAFDMHYLGYATVDQIIRMLNKQPLFEPHGENVPLKIVDKASLPAGGGVYEFPKGFIDKYMKLWQ